MRAAKPAGFRLRKQHRQTEKQPQPSKRFEAKPPLKSKAPGAVWKQNAHVPNMKIKENQIQNERQQITEQAGCPMIRVTTNDTDCVLPYSYLMRAAYRIQNDHYLIAAVWPTVTVIIEGYHLDQLIDWLAKRRLHLVALRTEIEQDRREGQPYLERISFVSRSSRKS
jgi:hypothetical protein